MSQPGSPPRPHQIFHIPFSERILAGLANATNSRFFTDCYSDSGGITPHRDHT